MVWFACAFVYPVLYNAGWYILFVLLTFLLLDFLILFTSKNGVEATRITPEKLSNGDENEVQLNVVNYYTFQIRIKIIDEIPFQFQIRNYFPFVSGFNIYLGDRSGINPNGYNVLVASRKQNLSAIFTRTSTYIVEIAEHRMVHDRQFIGLLPSQILILRPNDRAQNTQRNFFRAYSMYVHPYRGIYF